MQQNGTEQEGGLGEKRRYRESLSAVHSMKRSRYMRTEHTLYNPPVPLKEIKPTSLLDVHRNVDDSLTSSVAQTPPTQNHGSVLSNRFISSLVTFSSDMNTQDYQEGTDSYSGYEIEDSSASQWIDSLTQLREATDAAERQRRIQLQKEEEIRQQKLKEEEDKRKKAEEKRIAAEKATKAAEEEAKRKEQEAHVVSTDSGPPALTSAKDWTISEPAPPASSYFPLNVLKQNIQEEWIPLPPLSPTAVSSPKLYNAYVRNIVRVFEETQARALSHLSKVGSHPSASSRYPKPTWFDPMSFAASDSFAHDICTWNSVEAGVLLGVYVPGGSKVCVQRLDLLVGVRESVLNFVSDMTACLRQAWELDVPYLSRGESLFEDVDNKNYTRTLRKVGPHFILTCDRIASLLLARSMRDTFGLGDVEKVSQTQRARTAAAQVAVRLCAAIGCSVGPTFPIGALFRERFMAFLWQASSPSNCFFVFENPSSNPQEAILDALAGVSKNRRENILFRANPDGTFRLEWKESKEDPQRSIYASVEHASAFIGVIHSLQVLGPIRKDVNILGGVSNWTLLSLCIRAINHQSPFADMANALSPYYVPQLSIFLAHYVSQVSFTLASYYGVDSVAKLLDTVFAAIKKLKDILDTLGSPKPGQVSYVQCLSLSKSFPNSRLVMLENLLTSFGKSVEDFAGKNLSLTKEAMQHKTLPKGSKPYHFLTISWPIVLCDTREQDDLRIAQEEPEDNAEYYD